MTVKALTRVGERGVDNEVSRRVIKVGERVVKDLMGTSFFSASSTAPPGVCPGQSGLSWPLSVSRPLRCLDGELSDRLHHRLAMSWCRVGPRIASISRLSMSNLWYEHVEENQTT